MVTKNTINKIFTKLILQNKHLHGNFGTQIRKTLHNITNDKNEYSILRDTIFNFYKKYNSDKTTEHLEILSKNQNKFITHGKPNAREVEWTSEMRNVAQSEGLLYSIHNHPLTTSIQSQSDLEILLQGNIKYSITLSNDGLMIIKNNNEQIEIDENNWFRNDIYFNTIRQYNMFSLEENNNCKDKYPSEYQDIVSRLNNNSITEEQANVEQDSIFREYSKKNKYDYAENYIKHIETDTNLKVYHIPKIPKKNLKSNGA